MSDEHTAAFLAARAAAQAKAETEGEDAIFLVTSVASYNAMQAVGQAPANNIGTSWKNGRVSGYVGKHVIFVPDYTEASVRCTINGIHALHGKAKSVSVRFFWTQDGLPWEMKPGDTVADFVERNGDQASYVGVGFPLVRVTPDVLKLLTNKDSVFDLVVTAQALQKKELPKLVCIVDETIPEGLTLFGAKPKWGKSWNALDLGHAVATGGTYLGKQCRQGDVLYLALEDSERRMQDRMSKMVGDGPWPSNMLIVTIDKKFPRLDEGGIDLMKEWVEFVERPTLIEIDTLKKVRPREDKQRKAYDCDYEALESLHEYVASVPGLACVTYHHARKATAEDIFDDFSGTLGLVAVPDHLMIGARSAGNVKQKEVHARGRDLPEFAFAVQCDDSTKFHFVVLGEITEAKLNALEAAIDDVLKQDGGNMGIAQIHTALTARGMKESRDNVKQTCKRMYDTNKIGKSGKDAYRAAGKADDGQWPLVPIAELKPTGDGKWRPVTVEGVWDHVGERRENGKGEPFVAATLASFDNQSDVRVVFKKGALELVSAVKEGGRATLGGLLGPNDQDGAFILAKRLEGVANPAEEPF